MPTQNLKKKKIDQSEKMADEKIRMPSGIGGLVRYFDDYKSKIKIDKAYFIAFVVLVVVFYLFLHFK